MKKYLLFFMIFAVLVLFNGCDDNSTEADETAPEVVITNPVNNAEIESGQVVTIIAEATDNKGINKVEFKINGELEFEDEEEPYQFEWNTSGLNGSHSLLVKAWDTSSNTGLSDVINVDIIPGGDNSAPNEPDDPTPSDNADDVSITSNLSWTCTDPDGDILTYDVYCGIDPTPDSGELVSEGQPLTSYNLGAMQYETTYYWKIVASDGEYETDGDIWSFTTESSVINDIIVPDGFDYKTTRLLQITAQGPVNGTLKVKRMNDVVIYKGLIDSIYGFDQNIIIPSSITTLYFEYNEQVISRNIDLTTTVIELEFMEAGNPNNIDSDADRVPDQEDDYPDDPDRAYLIEYPAKISESGRTYGTIAFDDNWPYLNDFDYNDIIVNYNIRECLDSDGIIHDIWLDFYYSVDGTLHNNGFCVKLPFNENNITYVSFQSGLEGDYFYDNDGEFVIIVFEEADSYMQNPPDYHNTEEGSAFYEPTLFSICLGISGANSSQRSIEDFPPYNPFIFIDQDITREIHLTNYPPTGRFNSALFGTADDSSNPALDVYYISSTGLTWGIHLPEIFNHPYENIQIIDSYPEMVDWIESGGYCNIDWFYYPESEYVFPFMEYVKDIFE